MILKDSGNPNLNPSIHPQMKPILKIKMKDNTYKVYRKRLLTISN